MPPTTTLIMPVVTVAGIVSAIWESDQLVAAMVLPLMLMLLLPWVAPDPLPFTCTCVPAGPLAGEAEAITGLGKVKSTSWLLDTPLICTITGPVWAVPATVATICELLQLTTVPAATPP